MSNTEKKDPSFGEKISGFFNKTEVAVKLKVDHVMAAFRDTINDLELVAKTHTEEAVAHVKAIEELTLAKIEAHAEATRATSIAEKLKAIVS